MSQQERLERFLEEQVSRNFDYGREFRLKVSFDYRVYVFLSPRLQDVCFYEVVEFSKRLLGFEAYRLVSKGEHIIHLYLRYQSAETATTAIEELKLHPGLAHKLHVASVSDMLEAMYTIECCNRGAFPVWTSAIVDTVGEVRNVDPLHRQVICRMLNRFGDPRIYDLQWEGARVKSVQALFSSLAEALGASIAFGPWVDEREPFQNYHYRIRVVGGEKELSVFCQLKIPNVKMVFDMEYFVGGETTPTHVPPTPQPPVSEMAAELLVAGQRNDYRQANEPMPTNGYPTNPQTHRGGMPTNVDCYPTNHPAQRGGMPTNADCYPTNHPAQRGGMPTNADCYPTNHPAQRGGMPTHPDGYPTNHPTQRGGTHYNNRQRGGGGGRRNFPRRQFNNKNAPRQTQPQPQHQQQQETRAQQVPGSS